MTMPAVSHDLVEQAAIANTVPDIRTIGAIRMLDRPVQFGSDARERVRRASADVAAQLAADPSDAGPSHGDR